MNPLVSFFVGAIVGGAVCAGAAIVGTLFYVFKDWRVM